MSAGSLWRHDRLRLLSFQMAPDPQRSLAEALEKGVAFDFAYLSRQTYREFPRTGPLRKPPVLILEHDQVITEWLTISHHLDAILGAPFLFSGMLETAPGSRRDEHND